MTKAVPETEVRNWVNYHIIEYVAYKEFGLYEKVYDDSAVNLLLLQIEYIIFPYFHSEKLSALNSNSTPPKQP